MGNNRRLTSTVGMDFEDFTDYIYVLLKASWGDDWGTFTIEHPTSTDSTNIKFPQIVYEMTSSKPGFWGNNREIKPRFREEIQEIDEETKEKKSSSIFGQVLDMEITFYIYANSNKHASISTREFKNFLYESTAYFQEKGLSKLIFEEESYSPERSNETYSVRKLTYYVRLEEQYKIDNVLLKEIFVKADALYNDTLEKNSLPSQSNI